MSDLSRIDASELARDFAAMDELALTGPVMIVQEPQPPLILISAEEYARLERRDRQARAVENFPDAWLEAIARSPD